MTHEDGCACTYECLELLYDQMAREFSSLKERNLGLERRNEFLKQENKELKFKVKSLENELNFLVKLKEQDEEAEVEYLVRTKIATYGNELGKVVIPE